MLDKFVNEGNKSRIRVLEYLKKSTFDLKRFNIQDFVDYPGGIALMDKKNRKIVIYDDYLIGKIQVIYKKIKKSEDEIKAEIQSNLWLKYSTNAENINQIARLERDDNGNITFYRYEINEKRELKRVHTSLKFNECNELYDIYDYLKSEINLMHNHAKMSI